MIDFIIPALNSEKTIRRCLEAILALDHPEGGIKVYLVDNGSTDGTVKMVKDLPITILHCPQRGRSQARNFGMKHSSSDWVAFVDSDVVLDKSWLVEVMKYTSIPAVGSVQGAIIPAGQRELDRHRYQKKFLRTNGTFMENENMTIYFPAINTAACLVSRRALQAVGGFDEALERTEDYDLSLRMLVAGYSSVSTYKARAEVYFDGNWKEYFIRSFQAAYHSARYHHHFLGYSRRPLLLGAFNLSPSFTPYATLDKWVTFLGAICYLSKWEWNKSLLNMDLRQSKLNLFLPRIKFAGITYRFSMSKRFSVSEKSLNIFGTINSRFFKARSQQDVIFFHKYLFHQLTEQDLIQNEELIKLFIAEKILVADH